MGIVVKIMVEEDLEGMVVCVKESFYDVVFGGGEYVLFFYFEFFEICI